MAELLVNVHTGEVIHVAEDGHTWGRRESRAVYDAEVAALGRAPRAVVRDVVRVDEPVRDGEGREVRGGDGQTLTLSESRPVPGSERERDIPPPSHLGVVRVPGPVSDWAHLMDDRMTVDEGGELRSAGRSVTLSLTGVLDASAILAGTVAVDRATLTAHERRSEIVRGN